MSLNGIGVEVRPVEDVASTLSRWLRAGIESADVPGMAWDRLCGWLASQGDRIVAHSGPESRPAPAGGWLGRTGTVKLDSGSVEAVYVLPSAIDTE